MRTPGFAVSPTLGGAIIAIDLPGVAESDIDVACSGRHIVVDGSSTSGEPYHLDILLNQDQSSDRILSHKEEGHAWVLVTGNPDGPGCSFQLAN